VDTFNANNRWKKRGLAITPVRYEVTIWPRSSIVNIYGDGTIKILHGGCEMGQGLDTKVIQVAIYELNKIFDEEENVNPEDKVQLNYISLGDTDSFVNPNAIFTGGSTGSEGTAEATRRACAVLISRLKNYVVGVKTKKLEAQQQEEAKKKRRRSEKRRRRSEKRRR